MPRCQSPESLRMLSVGNIVENMEEWSSDYRAKYGPSQFRFIIGPFDALDEDSITALFKCLNSQRRMTKLYLQLLIVPNVKVIDFSGCRALITDSVMQLVMTRCVKVTHLNLASCTRVSSKTLLSVVQQFSECLTSLNLSAGNFNDKVANFIGSECKVLTVLHINNSSRLTQSGIISLFNHQTTGGNNELTRFSQVVKVLTMDHCPTRYDTVISILGSWCPQLLCFTADYFWVALAQLCIQNKGKIKLNLIGDKDSPSLDTEKIQEIVAVPTLMKSVSNLRHLNLSGHSTGIDLHFFQVLKELNFLKTLSLNWVLPFELLEYIGACCPDLTELDISIYPTEEWSTRHQRLKESFLSHITSNEHLLNSRGNPWSKLGSLKMHILDESCSNSVLPQLKSIFEGSKHSLRTFSLSEGSFQGIDEFICWAFKGRCLKLESISLFRCNLSASSVWFILLHDNQVCEIDIRKCMNISYSDFTTLSTFIEKENLNVSIRYDIY